MTDELQAGHDGIVSPTQVRRTLVADGQIIALQEATILRLRADLDARDRRISDLELRLRGVPLR